MSKLENSKQDTSRWRPWLDITDSGLVEISPPSAVSAQLPGLEVDNYWLLTLHSDSHDVDTNS